MSFQTAIAEAAGILSITVPASIISSTSDATAAKFVAIAHEAGDDIARRADWSRMLMSAAITALPFALPTDFLRLVPGGAVNLTAPAAAPVRGPLSSDQVRAIGRLGASSALYYAFEGGEIIGSRSLAGGEALSIYYVSKNWIISQDGASRRDRATADSDIALFPERLLSKAIIWRFRRETGMQYEDQLAEWEADLALEIRQNRGVTA